MSTPTLTVAEQPAIVETEQHSDYLTRREAAALCRVPLSTFDSLRRQNRFPFPDAHMGKHMLWRASTVTAFLDAGGTRGGD
ncbi:helix-turn-helix transcriptional regulator [Microbacterium sp. F2]|uniref:helix-turn-helix transcriptional regulator n=1 Tax=Microbacterium sp. F2 TaxID=3422228 RepID=UPI003FD4EE63|tara:strand:+ start:2976 stop:3218 length:243 start_codon:yes stop_codon:yes gene_type:complete